MLDNSQEDSSMESTQEETRLSATFMDTDVLDCSICMKPLTPPVFQCENGHIACSLCCTQLANRCPSCSCPVGKIRCLAMEKVIDSIKVSCMYEPYGCTETFCYTQKETHEETCIYAPRITSKSTFDHRVSEVGSSSKSNKKKDSRNKQPSKKSCRSVSPPKKIAKDGGFLPARAVQGRLNNYHEYNLNKWLSDARTGQHFGQRMISLGWQNLFGFDHWRFNPEHYEQFKYNLASRREGTCLRYFDLEERIWKEKLLDRSLLSTILGVPTNDAYEDAVYTEMENFKMDEHIHFISPYHSQDDSWYDKGKHFVAKCLPLNVLIAAKWFTRNILGEQKTSRITNSTAWFIYQMMIPHDHPDYSLNRFDILEPIKRSLLQYIEPGQRCYGKHPFITCAVYRYVTGIAPLDTDKYLPQPERTLFLCRLSDCLWQEHESHLPNNVVVIAELEATRRCKRYPRLSNESDAPPSEDEDVEHEPQDMDFDQAAGVGVGVGVQGDQGDLSQGFIAAFKNWGINEFGGVAVNYAPPGVTKLEVLSAQVGFMIRMQSFTSFAFGYPDPPPMSGPSFDFSQYKRSQFYPYLADDAVE